MPGTDPRPRSRDLNDTAIRALGIAEKDRFIPAGGRAGLYLRIRAGSDRKVWVIRRREGGQWRTSTIGEWPKVTARAARAQAEGSPEAPQRAETMRDALPAFMREELERRFTSAPREALAYLTRNAKPLHARRLDRITTPDIFNLIRSLSERPNTATKTLVLLKMFLRWCVRTGRLKVDPSASLTAKDIGLPSYQPRERVLSRDELREMWSWPDEPYGRKLRFALLTAVRINETAAMVPDNLRGDVWTIPAAFTKARREHVLPLGPLALRLAGEGWPPRAYKSLHSYMQARGVGWTIHDLRRTAATIMRDVGVPVDAIEAVLNHAAPRLQRTYQRPDLMPAKRDALLRLEAAVIAIADPPSNLI